MEQQPDRPLDELVGQIPEGWSRVQVAGEPWGVTRTTRAHGKVVTVSAERLGGADRLSANVWITTDGPVLRPCEVPADAVLGFLRSAAGEYGS
ncbi:peptide methionine sulfoxide reductase [Promicromonospora citrea]|uniref:Peptide methionine sulfoxide reductase n=1 Tax=Promicromonospora citrea TaxID=43677 RepID=A0A8H9GNT5_9MICO|nr:peptide methionine sulfoxide reductase [Promicromonospora citrea]NNH52254.1 peptide methionine sulfoxide reductase [Promicromonospora citrea]GGM40191.1 hypothetical protein GCM10010102_39740 [Promicromonospora citrea]